MKIAVIGQGLFGAIIGDHLEAQGHRVCRIDNRTPGSGSKPAACLMKPGWLSKVPRLTECLELLDGLYGVETIQFRVNNLLNQDVFWVNPAKILADGISTSAYMVESVNGNTIHTKRERVTFDKVIVAAGVWTRTLCPWVPVEPRWGAAFLWPEHKESVIPPFIDQWAPYKQVVAFQRGDGLWAGDGSALKSIDSDRELSMLRRCQEKLDIHTQPRILRGQRPYVGQNTPGHPCWLEQRGDLIVATGGAKNGTAAAAFCALTIGEWLGK